METTEARTKKLFGRDFTLMVVGQIISLFGNAVLRFALSVSVLDMTGSAAAFATISALSMLPMVLLSPLGGVLADRVSRKGIMAALDFTTAGLLAAFALLFHAEPGVAAIAVVMILLAIIQSFYQPSVQSSIPSLVGEESLMAANGVAVQVNALANLLGPVLGGFLYGIFGLSPILYASVVCFFLSAVMECFLHIPYVKRAMTGGVIRTVFSDFTGSLRFMVREQKSIFQLLLVVAGINLFLSSMITIGLPYLVKIFLGLSNQMYGLAEGAMGVGSILGGLLAGAAAKKLAVSQSHILLMISALTVVPLGAAVLTNSGPMISFGVILLSVAAMMCSATLFSVVGQTLIQKLTPADQLGKVMSAVTVISMCAFPLGQALYGVLFDWAGNLSFLVVLFSGAVCIVLGLLAKGILQKMKFPEESECMA